MIDPTTGAITEFPIPSGSSQPSGITVLDGNLWFTEQATGKIGEMTPTGHFTEFTVPATSKPDQITAGSDGNLWFTDSDSNEIWRFSPGTGTFSHFSVPTANSFPVGITDGPDGNIYFTEYNVSQIGMINPTTTQVTEYSIPTSGSQPYGVTAGPNGTVWFTEYGASKVGVATLTHIAVTSQPPGTVTAGTGFVLTISDVYDSGVVDQTYTGSVTINLATGPGGTTLGGTLTANFVNGAATFSGLTLTKAASGYSISATSSTGLPSVTSSSFNVAAAAASQLAIISQPPGTLTDGQQFGLQVGAFDSFGNTATSFSGSVNIALANNPGGSTLGGSAMGTASQGMVTFSGLSLNNAGNGYTITVSSVGLPTITTNAFQVTAPPPPPPPTIVSEQVVLRRKTNKKGKPIGKATLVGFQLNFNTAMNPGTAGSAANYQLNMITTKKVKKKIQQVLKPVGFQVSYNAGNNSVQLTLIGKQTFPKGGRVTVLASPTGGVSQRPGCLPGWKQ